MADAHEIVNVSGRLKSAIQELRRLDRVLCAEDLDSRILTEFRDALNRVRNTAWSAQQYISLRNCDQDSTSVLSLLAAERVRVTYQLCQSLQTDLHSADIRFQPAQLLQLQSAAKNRIEQLERTVEN